MQNGRPGVIVTLTSLIAITLAGCAAVGEPIEVEAPEWQSGYAWSYAYTEAFDFMFDENGEKDNHTDSDEGRYTIQTMNTTLKAGQEPVYVMISQYEGGRGRLRVVSQEDLGGVDYGYGYSSSCTNGQCTGSVDIDFDDEEIEWPAYLDFPLKTGKTWGAVIDLSDYGNGNISVAAAVEGAAMVELPMGPTKAAKVNHVVRPTSLAELKAEIREEASEEGYEVATLDILFEERQTVYFSPQYNAIVKRDIVETERFRATGTDPEGEPFDFRSEGTYTYSEVLDGARLAVTPEVPIDDLLPYLMGKAHLVDPSGAGIIDAGYTVGITPATVVVNAAESEVARFDATLDGVTELPAEHALKWLVRDRDGQTLKTGDGKQFQFAVDKPGRYGVAVEAREGQSLVSAAAATLVADWIGTTHITCPAASVLGVPACPAGEIPAHPGIRHLVVRAVPTGTLGATAGTAMTVYDAMGQPIAGTVDGNGHKVEVTDFDRYFIDDSAWTMSYRHGAGVASDVDMMVEAIYSSAPLSASASVGEERVPVMRGLSRLPW